MTAPTPALTSEQQLRLYMTPPGYDLAVQTFGAEMVVAVAAQHADLRLAAATLLEGLPASGGSGGGGLSSFKLDVLEFKFRDGTQAAPDWLSIAKRLRAEAEAASAGRRRSANPAPEIDPWGLA